MSKLEPTEAQRKALVDKLSEHVQWHRDGVEMAVDEMIAAANSIPDGAPVGTIARRPDGAWKAERKAGGAGPYWHYSTSAFWQADSPDWNSEDDADSWPVIYDPTGFSELSIDLGPDWGEWGCNTLVEALSALGVKPGMNLGDIYEMVEQGLEWFPPGEEPLVPRPDPTAQQEPDRFPGIENPTTADHVGADNADEQLKLIFALQCIRVERGLSVAHVGEALGLEDSEVERFESGSTNPTMSMIRRYARAVEAVFTVDVRKWEDSSAQQEPGESLARGLDDIAAGRVSRRDDYLEPQPEPKLCSGCCQCQAPKPPRTPRVVDRLGVDERGAEWKRRGISRVSYIWEYRFRNGVWQVRLVGNEAWASMSPGTEPTNGPYTEVLGDPS
ncbi:helix-turn-helix domain-containing protein [Mycobacteroides abscessus]|uniref:helix-turn-helix domain-containing protein n=1 Tax=Mycobacteroides abscessus TaxID=36809 RepID=UPI000C260844|nr:helix-turn-helix transcriptional regulator [Mycobacteroides abscessus]